MTAASTIPRGEQEGRGLAPPRLRSFAFEAVASGGVVERGTLQAESASAVKRTLSNRGLLPLMIKESSTAFQRTALSVADLALGLRIIADLMDAGLSVGRALKTFEELAPAGWRVALPSMHEAIKEGSSLAAALAAAPIVIPPVVLGIAQAGEAGQGIGPAIRRAAELMESAAATRAAVRAALAYPIVLAFAGSLAIGILIGVVLPRFADILADLNQGLPPATRFVMQAANMARAGAIPATIACIAVGGIWRSWVSTSAGRRTWCEWMLVLPFIGTIRFSAASARASHTLAALMTSGVPIAVSMRYAAAASGDAAVEARLLLAREQVTGGAALSRAVAEFRALTPTTSRLIRSGEESGKLGEMLHHAAKMEQQLSDRLIQTSVRLLEPMLVFAFAAVVAVVAAALLQAVYSVRPTA
jgi:type II secretory pathway component PulF